MRRSIPALAGALALGLLTAVLYIAWPGTGDGLEGAVYADTNGNGNRDAGEPGIAGVAVSDGRRVVLTDDRGRYRLPATDADTVFVIKPSGYRLPVDDFGKPRFYRHLDRAGPDGEPARSLDFALMPRQAPDDDFSILVFGDPQTYNERQVRYYERAIVDDVRQPAQYRFGLTLGDIVGNDPDLFEPVARATSRLGLPWWYVLGNHDLAPEAGDRREARRPYTRFFGPTAYAFNEGRVHFIVLDDIGSDAPGHVAGLDERQLAFVEANLRHVPDDRLIVLAMHIPPLGEWVFEGVFRLEDRQRLFDLLAGRPVLTLAAHTHTQWRVDFDKDYGWDESQPHHLYIVGTTAGDLWNGALDAEGLPDATMRDGTPNGYAVIHFDGPRYRLDWKAAGHPPDYRMRVHGPDAVHAASARPAGSQGNFFYVNYFMGYYSATRVATPVEYRVPGGEWQPMVPSFEPDPYRVALEFPWLQASWRDETPPPGKRPKEAVPSLHLWKARVPADGAPGERVLEIRVTAKDGRQFLREYRYTVIPGPAGG